MKKLLIIFFGILISSSLVAQQSNGCDDAVGSEITVGSSCSYSEFNSNNNSDYWNSAGTGGCNTADLDDAWVWFDAIGTTTTITYNPDNRDPIITLFEGAGSCATNMTEVACADDGFAGDNETIVYATTIGERYYVRLQRYNTNNNCTGDICIYTPCTPISNDDACSATAVATPLDGTNCLTSETNVCGTGTWYGGCVPIGEETAWYTATLTGSNDILDLALTNTTFGGNVNILLLIKNDACPTDANMTLVDDYCGADTGPIQFTGLTAGQEYHIAISTAAGDEGDFDLCGTESVNPAIPGDDCASAIRVDCGDPILDDESTDLNSNDESNWDCLAPITTPGGDRYYVVQWPDAANGGAIRLDFTDVSDANGTLMEVLALGSSCTAGTCVDESTFDITTGLFGTSLSFYEFTVGAGIADYYFVVDSQGDGIDNYDLEVTCFATGLELDVDNSCTPIPATEAANQGYYQTWDGVAPPATADPASMTGTYTICENIYVQNVGWEWLKYFDITLGECWTNPTNFSPNGTNNGMQTPTTCNSSSGDWAASESGGVINWDYTSPQFNGPPAFAACGNSTWGDGVNLNNNYTCALYTFCFDANVDPACNALTGFQNGVTATDDGIGAGGGGAVNPSNITLGTTSPTVLPVHLLSFDAKVTEKNGKNIVALNWRTASEKNNDYFTVERSKDGKVFEEVFRMSGAGNSNELNSYVGIDQNPNKGVSYYRLKQTDFNGAYEYFDMISVSISNLGEIELYPNPVKSELNIVFDSKKDNSEVFIKVYNVQGKLIFNENKSLSNGMNKTVVSMDDFSQGVYFITVENDGQIEKMKFFKE